MTPKDEGWWFHPDGEPTDADFIKLGHLYHLTRWMRFRCWLRHVLRGWRGR